MIIFNIVNIDEPHLSGRTESRILLTSTHLKSPTESNSGSLSVTTKTVHILSKVLRKEVGASGKSNRNLD